MSDTTPKIRIWPAIAIVAIELAVTYGILYFGSTNVQNVIAIAVSPVFATIALAIWWFVGSGAPVRDKLMGFALFLVAIAVIVFTHSPLAYGGFLLASALPVLNVGIVLLLVLTAMFPWSARRAVLIMFLVGCAAAYVAMRVETVGGDLKPVVAWRWTPSAAQRSEALAKSESHGTAALPAQVSPQDWPGFRGPLRDASAAGVKFATDWSTPPRRLWKKPIGPGMSSFVVIGDYAFTQEQRGENEVVACYDAKNGEVVWTNSVKARFEDAMGLGPRATPAFDSGKLYVQGAMGLLQCLDAATGKAIWTKDLSNDNGKSVPTYGFCSSPLVVGDNLIVYDSGSGKKRVAAFNKTTGAELWTAGDKLGGGYSSPHLATLGGVQQLLMFADSGIQSFDPATGKAIWEHAWPHKQYPRCVQPLIMDDETILLGATSDTGSRLLRVRHTDDTWVAKDEWTMKDFRPYFNDCVQHKGYCYGFDGNRLDCLDAKTGERKWKGARCGGQVMILPDMDMLLVLEEKGDVALIKADPAALTEIARFKAINGKTWNHPVVAHGKLFVRNSDEAACFELPGAANKVAANN